jgi:phosphoribosylformylglycinamidine synthase
MLRYATPSGEPSEDANPNGSIHNIAGIVNERGNVVGLMPHLDRCYDSDLGTDHGLRMFRSLIASVS